MLPPSQRPHSVPQYAGVGDSSFGDRTLPELPTDETKRLAGEEYGRCLQLIDAFDGRVLTIQAWSITGSLVGIGIGLRRVSITCSGSPPGARWCFGSWKLIGNPSSAGARDCALDGRDVRAPSRLSWGILVRSVTLRREPASTGLRAAHYRFPLQNNATECEGLRNATKCVKCLKTQEN